MGKLRAKKGRAPAASSLGMVILGGPSYQMLLDARHSGSMLNLAVRLVVTGRATGVATNWGHGCPVEMARNRLFQQALELTEATHLCWMDSDCFWPAEMTDGWIWAMEELARRKAPFCGFPVHQRNGDSNVVESIEGVRHHRLRGSVKMEATMKECAAMGLGAAVFYLPWYRDNWSSGPWFRTDWTGGEMTSEDFWHTSRLYMVNDGRAGDGLPARPLWSPVLAVQHAPRGVLGDAP